MAIDLQKPIRGPVLVVLGIFLVSICVWFGVLEIKKRAYHKRVSYGAERVSICLRMLPGAEDNFRRLGLGGDKKYAWSLHALYETRGQAGNPMQLIDKKFLDGEEEGYRFGELRTCDGSGSKDSQRGFAYYAVPVSYAPDGLCFQTCIINQDGQVWTKDTGGRAVDEWPRDPEAEGWVAVGRWR